MLPGELRQQIIDHCVSALPNEGCGLLAMDGKRVARVYPTANDDASPFSYTIPPQSHYDALIDAEGQGWDLAGAFHSHPNGPPAMSGTDLVRVTDAGWLYLVVSLAGPKPLIVGWRDGVEVTFDDGTG